MLQILNSLQKNLGGAARLAGDIVFDHNTGPVGAEGVEAVAQGHEGGGYEVYKTLEPPRQVEERSGSHLLILFHPCTRTHAQIH